MKGLSREELEMIHEFNLKQLVISAQNIEDALKVIGNTTLQFLKRIQDIAKEKYGTQDQQNDSSDVN
jgi:hypothetical protein